LLVPSGLNHQQLQKSPGEIATMGVNLPQITLDTTLTNLYTLDGGNPQDLSIVTVIPPPTQVSSSLPSNTKFVYQHPNHEKFDDDIYARILLGAVAQHLSFVAGSIPVNLFDIDKTYIQSWLSLIWTSTPGHRVDAQRVYDALVPAQRPRLDFITNPDDFLPIAPSGKLATVVASNPLDCLSKLPGIITPEVHYKLLSKHDLVHSGLPMPPSDVLTTSLAPAEVEDDSLVRRESSRFINAVKSRALPFVLKFPQSLAGYGVFVVRTESDRDACIAILQTEIALMIRSLNTSNAHLNPVSLIFQDMLPGGAVAHNIFVTKTGRPVFIGTCEQVIDKQGNWSGAMADYKRQEELGRLYAPTTAKMAEYVFSKGYYGPMGADIMISEDQQYVIDLNVRLTGSYSLSLLKGHFSERRGLHFATLMSPVPMMGDRNTFEKKFTSQLENGRLVIVGWCEGRFGPGRLIKYSMGCIVVGGEDKAAMMDLVDRVNEVKIKR
jgi:hypothetical protein